MVSGPVKALHEKVCPNKPWKCRMRDCSYQGDCSSFIPHLLQAHFPKYDTKNNLIKGLDLKKYIEKQAVYSLVYNLELPNGNSYSGQIAGGVPEGLGYL